MKKFKIALAAIIFMFVANVFVVSNSEAAWNAGVRVVQPSLSKVDLYWNSYSGATSYKLYKSTQALTGYSEERSYISDPSTYYYVDEGRTYYFKIVAMSNNKKLAESEPITVSTASVIKPSQTNATASNVTLAWAPQAGASSYDVYRYSYPSKTLVAPRAANVTNATIAAPVETGYEYYVVVNRGGLRLDPSFTDWISSNYKLAAKTLPYKNVFTSQTYYWSTSNKLSLYWTSLAGTNTVADGYQCEMRTYKNKLVRSVSTTSKYTDMYLKKGVFCYFRVRPYICLNGNVTNKRYGAWSDKIYTALPKSATVKRAGKKKLKVSWKKISGATQYVVQVSNKINSGFKTVKKLGKKKKSCIIKKYGKKKLKPGKWYYVRILYKTKVGKKKVQSKIYTKFSSIYLSKYF